MNKDLVKKAVKSAENDLKEQQVKEVKKIVLKTLERLEGLKDERKEVKENLKSIDERIKILKMDLDDLKEGRLDRISERQEKDAKAKDISVVIVIKEKEVIREYPYWHWPYRIVWEERRDYHIPSTTTIGDYLVTEDSGTTFYNNTCSGSYESPVTISCSVAKWGAKGSYTVGDSIINFR